MTRADRIMRHIAIPILILCAITVVVGSLYVFFVLLTQLNERG